MKRSGFTNRGKPMKRKASKPKARPKSATGPMVEPDYANGVRGLPCAACGRSGPSEIHHCKDRPPFDESPYRYFPGHGEKSADFDGIPLCGPDGCHRMFHTDHGEYARRYGPDYQYIENTRKALEYLT